jgi:putative addiction module component (TIGR02574 family)
VTTEDLIAVALRLPRKDRAGLADRLLKSLDELPETEWEAEWVAESQRRLEEVRAGRMRERPATDVFRDADSYMRNS